MSSRLRRLRRGRRAQPQSIAPSRPHRLATHASAVLLILLVGAAGLRLVCFLQMQRTVFVDLHRQPETDMHYYDRWARQIAAGDWLSRSIGVPMHSWHLLTARAWFDRRPEARPAGVSDEAAAERLWSAWLDVPRFYQDPLYPYLVAITYRLAGADVRHVFAWQLALGVVATALVWAIARRHFGDAAAAIAGALFAFAAPLLYYELILLKESLIVFASLLIVWLADRARTSVRRSSFVALGVALGLSALLKSTFGLAIVAFVGATAWTSRRDRARLRIAVPALVAGLAIGVSPLVVRNLAVGVPPLALGSTGPLTFAISNARDYRPETGFALDPAGLAGVMGRHDGQAAGVMLETIRQHTPATAAMLVWHKIERLWHWYEIPNNENFSYVRLWVPVLRWLPVTFLVCAPLAWIGVAVAVGRVRETWPILVMLACSIAPMVVFYVLGRFRTAALALLLPFAAAGLVEVASWVRAGAYRTLAAGVAVVVGLTVWMGRPLPEGRTEVRPADWLLPMALRYGPEAQAALDRGDPLRASAALQEFLTRYAPSEAQLRASGSAELALTLAKLHEEYGRLRDLARSTRGPAP